MEHPPQMKRLIAVTPGPGYWEISCSTREAMEWVKAECSRYGRLMDNHKFFEDVGIRKPEQEFNGHNCLSLWISPLYEVHEVIDWIAQYSPLPDSFKGIIE